MQRTTLMVEIIATASKVQKNAIKSSTEAEIVAVSDGMNIRTFHNTLTFEWYNTSTVTADHHRNLIQQEAYNLSNLTLFKKR